MSNSACAPCTRKNGNLFRSNVSWKVTWRSRVGSLTQPNNDLMTLGMCFCHLDSNMKSRLNERMKTYSTYGQKKWTTPHVQCAMNWFFKLMHKLASSYSLAFISYISCDIFALLALNDVLPRCAPQRNGSLDPDSTRSRARADITTQLVVQRMTYEPGRFRIPGIP